MKGKKGRRVGHTLILAWQHEFLRVNEVREAQTARLHGFIGDIVASGCELDDGCGVGFALDVLDDAFAGALDFDGLAADVCAVETVEGDFGVLFVHVFAEGEALFCD